MSSSLSALDTRIQKWVYRQGWSALRDIQEEAIEPILSGGQDIIISASTASGKTEAFFLPACSAIAENTEGFGIVYISPLKALINDQFRRLEGLCEMLDMQLVPWHGDSSQSRKRKAKKSPSGILLITPESLESLLIRESGWAKSAFSALQYIVIDEFHAFIGTERGTQLLSQLNRLETLLDRQSKPIPRIALSATLGELETVPKALRHNANLPYRIITGDKGNTTVLTKLFGYLDTPPRNTSESADNITIETAKTKITKQLYKICKGGFHLIFANSRSRVEELAVNLSELCEYHNEFFPHHGSLSKELRETLESRLQKGNLPTTAVCTMTLELGIDIGKVDSVAQVTAPHSVSSLRQRLGRSGRRKGSHPTLRMFITESELSERSGLADKLRLELLQSIAMIRLILIKQWFEPADTHLFHFSTLLHQILALLAQWGGIRPDQVYSELCQRGPFHKTTAEQFKQLLRHMGNIKLITQLQSGELVLGIEGEKLVDHYSFYAVFKTPDEYRVLSGAKSLGTIPIEMPITIKQNIIFGGRRWIVAAVDIDKKIINVIPSKGGNPPKFSSGGMSMHDNIREEMLDIYMQADHRVPAGNKLLSFLDDTAEELFQEGLKFFNDAGMRQNWLIQMGQNIHVILWRGDKIVNTLMFLLIKNGFTVSAYAGVIEIEKSEIEIVKNYFHSLLLTPPPTNTELAELAQNKQIDKFDEFLPEVLLNQGYGQKAFDVEATMQWLKTKLLNEEHPNLTTSAQ